MSRVILGLDLGEASVGTALVRLDRDEQLVGIEHMGSRVFQSVLDPKSKVPLNMGRRTARGARKNRERRVRRRVRLENALTRAGLLPAESAAKALVMGRDLASTAPKFTNPYELRAKALAEPLTPEELGRAFAHLGQRRGFRSNKKARLAEILKDDPEFGTAEEAEEIEGLSSEEAKEQRETLEQIRQTQEILDKRNLTLGQYLAECLANGERVRGRRTSREMYIAEFEAIWESQSLWHPNLLSEDLHREVRATFEQRPLQQPRVRKPRLTRPENMAAEEELNRLVRNCRIFPDKSVARADHFYAHRFRILQALRNLRYVDGEGNEVSLTTAQFRQLAERLQKEKSLTWAEIRKTVGIPKTTKFSVERDVKVEKGLPGNRTEIFFKAVLGDAWDDSLDLDRETIRRQLEFMQDIDTAPEPHALYKLLQRPKANGNRLYPISKQQAFAIADRTFSSRTLGYSARALRQLSEELLRGSASTYHAAQEVSKKELEKMPVLDRLPEPPFIANPRVRRCLYEVRKVVNALIDTYGKPTEIRIELARDMKETERDRLKRNQRQKEGQDRNAEAKKFYAEHGKIEPTREDILRYRLWRECEERCPYTGAAISQTDLLSDRVEVEHILPLPRSGDDSYSNLTLTFRETNQDKGNRIPVEWLGEGTELFREARRRFEAMKNRSKLRKFETKEIDDDFTQRQLTDTRYACRAAMDYLKCLGVDVWVSNGTATDLLRREWGLNNLLPVRETKKKIDDTGGKHRLDHRHHAVDALVVALTTAKVYRKALEHKRGYRDEVQAPTENFRTVVKAIIDQVITSHDLDKGIRGALHDEMFYGRKLVDGEPRYVRRVSVREFGKSDDFQKAMAKLENVYDDDLRKRLVDRLRAFGDPKAAFGEDRIELQDGAGRKMVVETVRIRHRLGEAVVDLGGGRWTKPNSNHHAEIVRNRKGKYECRVVTMIDAARRIRGDHRTPYGLSVKSGEELVMCLSVDEVVEYDGRPMRVVTISEGDLRLRDLNDGRSGDEGCERLSGSDKFQRMTIKLGQSLLGPIAPNGP